jgi:dolichyl-phosphate-mannose-protein mannosyltransferase
VAMDCMFIVYSRYSLMEGMLVFFCMLTFLGALLAKKPWQIVLVAVSFGMAVSVKWLCLATIVPVLYIFWRRGLLWDFILDLPFSVLVYVVSVMSGEAINGSHNLWADFILWHKQVWGFETSLTATHPWGSVWWTWPLLYKPLLFFREATADGHSQIIVAIPNPCLWWSSGVAVVLSIGELVRQRFILKRPIADHLLVPLLLGWAAFWLPWAGVHRVLFIYHYLPSFGFALFMLVFWLAKLWHRMSELVVLFIALALVVTLFFIPLLMALPVPQEWVQTHVWIASWVY